MQLAVEDDEEEVISLVHVIVGKNCPFKESRTQDTGFYSIVTGGADPSDGNCYYRTVHREMAEEFKIATTDDDIEATTWFMHLGSPVFIVHVGDAVAAYDSVDDKIAASDDNISLVEEARSRVVATRADDTVPEILREMCDLALVPLSSFPLPDGTQLVAANPSLPNDPSSPTPGWPTIPLTSLTVDVLATVVGE